MSDPTDPDGPLFAELVEMQCQAERCVHAQPSSLFLRLAHYWNEVIATMTEVQREHPATIMVNTFISGAEDAQSFIEEEAEKAAKALRDGSFSQRSLPPLHPPTTPTSTHSASS